MNKHLLWSASCAWLVLMAIVWTLFVPKGLSVGTFTLFALAGPMCLVAAREKWGTPRRARPIP